MSETVGQRLLALKARSGMSLHDIATAAGYRGGSSIQKFFHKDYADLSSRVARNLAQALVGRGSPAITEEDVLSIAGVLTRSSGHALLNPPEKRRRILTMSMPDDAPDEIIVNGVRYLPC